MPVNKSFLRRLEIIDDCLKRKQRIWTKNALKNEISNKIEEECFFDNRKIRGNIISDSTFYNDINYLKEKYNAPIECKDGAYSYSDEFNFYPSPLTPAERAKISKLVSILNELDGISLLADFAETVARLNAILRIDIDGNDKIIRFEHHSTQRGSKEYFNILFQAVASKTEVEIAYKRFESETTKTYIFYPYLLKEHNNRWYLIGKIKDKEEIITLSLDRIEQVKPGAVGVYNTDGFDPDTYFANTIGITVDSHQKPELVKFLVKKSQVPYFETQPIHSSQCNEKNYPNGDALYSLTVAINYDLKLLLMQYAHLLKIITPKLLKAELHDMLKEGLKNNKMY